MQKLRDGPLPPVNLRGVLGACWGQAAGVENLGTSGIGYGTVQIGTRFQFAQARSAKMDMEINAGFARERRFWAAWRYLTPVSTGKPLRQNRFGAEAGKTFESQV